MAQYTGRKSNLAHARVLLAMSALLLGACAADAGTTSGGRTSGQGSDEGDGDGSEGGDGDDEGDGDGKLPQDFEECASEKVTAGLAKAGNIVWVIDTSGSMDEEAALVQDNMNAFAQSIVTAGLTEYRVVVISERDFVNVPDPLGSDAEHFLFLEQEVGSNEPLEKLLEALGDYRDFLLPGAMTHFVVVTDDESDLSADAFIAQMKSQLAEMSFRVHAIASPPGEMPPEDPNAPFWEMWIPGDDGCEGEFGAAAAPGVEHYTAAAMTEGLTFSICESDWSGLFSELATEVGASATIPCELGIPQAEAGTELDLNLVNLVLSDEAGSRVVPRAKAAGSCSGKGWAYDSEENPTQIVLCKDTCDAAAKAKSIDIALGCATEIL
jgi:hypothetical protein